MTVEVRIPELMSPLRRRLVAPFAAAVFTLALAMPSEAVVPAHGGAESRVEGEDLAKIGTGMLLWGLPGSRQALPMLDLLVEIDVTGIMVHGTVIQAFENPSEETIEALYVFPLPERAAIHHMEIRIGERRIVSVIQEREEARRIYESARREGRKAALLEQDRPNLFATAVAGVNPGEEVHVRLEYIEELGYDDGAFQMVFPLTYTPRYGPPTSPETDGGDPTDPNNMIPDAEQPRARLSVRLRTGLPLEEPESDSHAITSWWDNDVLVIEPESGAPVAADRDFHLRFVPQVGREPEATLLTENREEGRYALLMVLPSLESAEETGLATETLFIVDISGSMSGPSIRQARVALAAAVQRLHPDDAFNILAFNDGLRVFSGDYVPAGDAERTEALQWIEGLAADGGTRIDLALAAGLDMVDRDETWRVERIIFLTDGAVSTEDVVLERIRSRLGSTRLHTLGIGAAPNRYLMRQMAASGRGLCAFISRIDQAENRIDTFLSRLSRPVMTDIALAWEGAVPLETFPERLPDLHAGEPLTLSARFGPGDGPGRLVLDGRIDGSRMRRVLEIGAGAGRPTGIATRWARAKVGDLMDSLHEGANPEAVRRAVIDVSRRFGIMTRFTSLVAVEEFPTANGDSRRVRVPSTAPDSGQLPRGGTQEPLIRLAMILCTLAAGVTGFAARAVRRVCREEKT